MKLTFGIAEGKDGHMLLIKQGKSWWILFGEPFKRKDFHIKETFEVEASQVLTRISDLLKDVS